MSNKFHIVEPHPTTTSTRIHSGRGGAGNITKTPSSITRGCDATGPASRISLSSASSRRPQSFSSGRGGAGNMHHSQERAIFSFDEELQSQLRRENVAPVYHVGRGGAGNVSYDKPGNLHVYIDGSVRRKDSETDSSRSTSSVESGADAATRNLKKGLQKGWGRISSVGSYMVG